jgi:hypothetical protein
MASFVDLKDPWGRFLIFGRVVRERDCMLKIGIYWLSLRRREGALGRYMRYRNVLGVYLHHLIPYDVEELMVR